MQMILLMSVVCAASGFTLEMPELPDLIGTVGKVFGGNFTLKMVEEPKVFLPKVSQIESMTREESMERFHWFFCVYDCLRIDFPCRYACGKCHHGRWAHFEEQMHLLPPQIRRSLLSCYPQTPQRPAI